MSSTSLSRDWRPLARIGSRTASLTALVIGGAELAAWLIQPAWLPRDSPIYFMKANSAFSVVLLSAGCLLTVGGTGGWRRGVAAAGSGIVLIVTVGTLLEYLTGWSPGLDTWLATDPTIDRGRMAAQSAAVLTCGAVALLAMPASRGPGAWIANTMLIAAAMTLEMMVLGFYDDATLLYDVTGLSPAAPQSAVAQMLVVIALTLGRAGLGALPVLTGQSRGSVAVRLLMPVIVLLPIGLALLRAAGETLGFYTTPYGHTLFTVAQTFILGSCVYGFARSMNRLDDRYRKEREQREEYERLVAVCAWTRRVRWNGTWLSIEDFLRQRFNLNVSHGISEEALAEQLAGATATGELK